MKRLSLNTWLVLASLIVVVFPLVLAIDKMFVTHEARFLRPEGGAQWIRMTKPFDLEARRGTAVVAYRKQFTVERAAPSVVLTIRAVRTAQVYLDGRVISPFNAEDDGTKPRFVELRGLEPGSHMLVIGVLNENGPSVLLAYCSKLGIFTGPGWQVREDGTDWRAATPAEERRPPDESLFFASPLASFRSLIPIYLPLIVISLLGMLSFKSIREKYPRIALVLEPSTVRWGLLAAWVVLSVNNITKIPLDVGYDASAHYDYIAYIAKRGTIPFATEGWQMFQSPLYYILSAGFQEFLSLFLSGSSVLFMLRIIPLMCGALQVELAYRALRFVFPGRKDLQIIGMIVGGLLPMNLYISQAVGNDPLAGVLSAGAVVLALRMLTREGPPTKKEIIFLGTLNGLAFLTKVTAVLLIPALVLVLIYVMSEKKEPTRRIIFSVIMFFGVVAVISGWYYLRNWIVLGKPFFGGWDVSRGIVWWQEPGYRIAGNFLSFGWSLTHPIFSGINGFWDSVYSTFWLDGQNSSIISYGSGPPWNYDFMLSTALLALLPSGGILLGFVMSGRPRTARPGMVFASYCTALYFTALLYIYVTVPIYSAAKATYTIGLLPCYAILCAAGLDYFTRNKYARAVVYALLVCWTIAVYSSYFVV